MGPCTLPRSFRSDSIRSVMGMIVGFSIFGCMPGQLTSGNKTTSSLDETLEAPSVVDLTTTSMNTIHLEVTALGYFNSSIEGIASGSSQAVNSLNAGMIVNIRSALESWTRSTEQNGTETFTTLINLIRSNLAAKTSPSLISQMVLEVVVKVKGYKTTSDTVPVDQYVLFRIALNKILPVKSDGTDLVLSSTGALSYNNILIVHSLSHEIKLTSSMGAPDTDTTVFPVPPTPIVCLTPGKRKSGNTFVPDTASVCFNSDTGSPVAIDAGSSFPRPYSNGTMTAIGYAPTTAALNGGTVTGDTKFGLHYPPGVLQRNGLLLPDTSEKVHIFKCWAYLIALASSSNLPSTCQFNATAATLYQNILANPYYLLIASVLNKADVLASTAVDDAPGAINPTCATSNGVSKCLGALSVAYFTSDNKLEAKPLCTYTRPATSYCDSNTSTCFDGALDLCGPMSVEFDKTKVLPEGTGANQDSEPENPVFAAKTNGTGNPDYKISPPNLTGFLTKAPLGFNIQTAAGGTTENPDPADPLIQMNGAINMLPCQPIFGFTSDCKPL